MNINKKPFILYDGECPFCDNYIKLMNLKSIIPEIQILDAHNHHDMVIHFRNNGLEINDGMILSLDGAVYYGSECVHALAMLTNNNTTFYKLNKVMFQNKQLARILYPILVYLRKLYFFFFRKTLIK